MKKGERMTPELGGQKARGNFPPISISLCFDLFGVRPSRGRSLFFLFFSEKKRSN